MKKSALPTNRIIAEYLRTLKIPLDMKYSADGVWFRASPIVDDDCKLKGFEVTFKYYDNCVNTGEAGYCYVKIKGVEFRHWPFYASEWNEEPWECESLLEDDGVSDEELSELIDSHVEVPDEILVDQVDFQIESVMTRSAVAASLKESIEWGGGELYRDIASENVYLVDNPEEAKRRNLVRVSPRQAVRIVWGKLEFECGGAC